MALLDRGVAALLEVLPLDGDLGFQGRQVALAGLGVHPGDHVGREVDDLLQVLGCEVEEVAQAAGHALEVPDVGDGSGQLDVAHAFPPHLGPRDLDTAAFANDALEADPLVLTAVALPVPGRTEDLLAEESVLFGLEGPVVDGFRLFDLAVRPLTDVVSGRETNPELVEEVDVEHLIRPLLLDRGIRPLRHCSAHADQGRYPVLRPHGRRLPRCRASRWTCRRGRAPPRSGTATASP